MQSLGITCPVCGKYVFESENDYDICDVCGWENDELQRNDADYIGGANYISLNVAKVIFELKKNANTKKKIKDLLMNYNEARISIKRKYQEMQYNKIKELHSELSKALNDINKEI